jgi:glycosyltransferase involved in cell wall biosynthesis
LRVLHTLNALRPSGAERMLECSYGQWRSEEVEPIIIGMSDDEHVFSSALEKAGYEVHFLPSSRSVKGLCNLSRMLVALRPDVVHIHAEQAFPYVSAIAAASPAKAVVRSVHSNFKFTGWVRTKRSLRIKATRAMSVSWVSVSDEVANNERLLYGNPTRTIENWVDIKALSGSRNCSGIRAQLGLSAAHFVVTIIGDCRRVKNHSLLFRALDGVQRPVHVLHVGDQSNAHAEERRLWRLVPPQHKVHHLGLRDDVPDLLAITDVLAQPSLLEGFPLAVAEALCSGTAVLVNDAPGLRWVDDFRQASRVRADPKLWGKRLDELASEPGGAATPRKDLGQIDAAMGHARFAPDRGVAQYAELYRWLISRRKRERGA